MQLQYGEYSLDFREASVISFVHQRVSRHCMRCDRGRVLIDTREQPHMTAALAKSGGQAAFFDSPKLKTLRIVGKDFDIVRNKGDKEWRSLR